MGNENKFKPTKASLFYMMQATDEQATKADTPDGAWQAMIENCVSWWNAEHNTDYDENDLFHEYLDWLKTE